MSDSRDSNENELHINKEQEQEKRILYDLNDILEKKSDELEKSKHALEKIITKEFCKSKELEQENIILKTITERNEATVQKLHKKYYVSIAIIAIIISGGLVSFIYYENHVVNPSRPVLENYNSNYVIQNLQGDTVNTWVAWNVATGRVIHIHVTNTAQLSQSMLDTMKDAILSTKTVTINDSLTGKGSKDSSSTYYAGWEGAIKDAYTNPTKEYIPQQFEFDGSPNGVGDIEIILTNDVNPDGYSGYTKSLVDNNEILKSKITIFKANKIDPDRLGAIIRHEFGHALGLGHSTATEDLMSPMLPDYPYISSCDVDTLKGLYNGNQNSKVVCKK